VPAEEDYQRKWYQVVENDSLRQGDLFRSLLVFWPSKDLEPSDTDPGAETRVPFDWGRGDYIVLSASCDVDQRGYPYVLMGRVVPATSQHLKCSEKELAQQIEVRRQGLVPSQFLLAPFQDIEPPFHLSLVTWKTHALIPIEYLRRSCTMPRLRLKSPHRERFGNWAGTNLSRVGPETDAQIPRGPQIFPAHVIAANNPEE
jgi:hypothetical protein